jgi:hypothetical protein
MVTTTLDIILNLMSIPPINHTHAPRPLAYRLNPNILRRRLGRLPPRILRR